MVIAQRHRVSRLKIYTLSNCDTCRHATKWLRAHDIDFDEIPIRQQPPTADELKQMLTACEGALRRLFNTSGREYREQKLGDRLPEMAAGEALKLLAQNGNLVKRPFLIGAGVAVVGFDEGVWRDALIR
jgi:arsenate reductase (glutaredoxin)